MSAGSAARVAVIADTHMPRGTRRLPDACVAELRAADLIVHAGDFSGPEALAEIGALGELVAVHGNVDAPAVRAALPQRTELEIAGARLGLLHDAGPKRGRFERLRRAFPGTDAVVFGHSHMPLHERSEGFQIFNPGSPTERRRAPARTMGVAEVEAGEISFRLLELSR